MCVPVCGGVIYPLLLPAVILPELPPPELGGDDDIPDHARAAWVAAAAGAGPTSPSSLLFALLVTDQALGVAGEAFHQKLFVYHLNKTRR